MQMCLSVKCRQSSAPKSRDFAARYKNDIFIIGVVAEVHFGYPFTRSNSVNIIYDEYLDHKAAWIV